MRLDHLEFEPRWSRDGLMGQRVMIQTELGLVRGGRGEWEGQPVRDRQAVAQTLEGWLRCIDRRLEQLNEPEVV